MLKIAYNKIYRHKLRENHRFPMIKYELIPEQLIREGICDEENFFSPNSIDEQHILTTHSHEYLTKLSYLDLTKKESRPIGFPLSDDLVQRENHNAGNP